MTLRTGHGKGAGSPRVEVLPPDELPEAVPGPARAEARGDRGPGGRFARGNALARWGGQAKAGQTKFASKLGLADLPESSAFAKYKRAAAVFRRVRCTELAQTAGGGVCGPGPSSIVVLAAAAMAWSKFFGDKAAELASDPIAAAELAMKSKSFGETARQHMLAAYELCVREAAARPRVDDVTALAQRLGIGDAEK